jgi:hypothetical protein
MARWRLIENHYIKTRDPTKWEYLETDRQTGRQKRTIFEVPRFIQHDDPADWTIRENGEGYVTVSDGHNADPRDIIFVGEPTPGMLALDDEARAVSKRHEHKWVQPNGLLENGEFGWASKLTDTFIQQQDVFRDQMAELATRPVPGMEQFMSVMTQVIKQQQDLMMQVMAKQQGVTPVVDNLEPLGRRRL